MKPKEVIQSVELSTIAHATEDLEKVQTALTHLLPDSLRSRQLFTRRYLQGHYGNPIVTFEARLTEPADVGEFKACLLKQLSTVDRLSISKALDKYTDEDGNLYVRLDKQKMYLGRASLGQDDPIRLRMKFTKFAGTATALMVGYLESE